MQDDTAKIVADFGLVFGRERLRMVTGEHVEVVREAAAPGERLLYAKRFLETASADFRPWTGREAQVLARLASHGPAPTPDVAAFEAAASGQPAVLRTVDAGVSVDLWTTLQPTHPDRSAVNHVFEDCGHWWALAHQCLKALEALHDRQLVHLDFKADNVCIPWVQAKPVPPSDERIVALSFRDLSVIDFAFSVFTGEDPPQPLPIGRSTKYDYQSPRLLDALGAGRRGNLLPTRQLDWRCDFFSLAAMLWLYLPEANDPAAASWSAERHAQATVLVRRLLDEHNADLRVERPHKELIAFTSELLSHLDLAASVRHGWGFQPRSSDVVTTWSTPPTRVVASTPSSAASPVQGPSQATAARHGAPKTATASASTAAAPERRRPELRSGSPAAKVTVLALLALPLLAAAWWMLRGPAPSRGPVAGAPVPVAASAPASAVPVSTSAPVSAPAAAGAETLVRPTAPEPAVVRGAPPASAVATDAAPASPAQTPPAQVPEPEPEGRAPPAGEPSDAAALLTAQVPEMAEWADRRMARVLKLADTPRGLPRRKDLRAAVAAARLAPGRPSLNVARRSQEARRLNEAARVAYWQRNDVPAAVALQTQAFTANPLDSEVAGNLAFLRMRQQPPQIRWARQLALHSLSLPDARYPSGRVQDWTTLAIASALLGREADARHAWYISLALTPDLRRQRTAATRAVAIYGERLRPSVEAMLQRAAAVERSKPATERRAGRSRERRGASAERGRGS
jgi:hypothetical protein